MKKQKEKKPSGFSRLMAYAGGYKVLTYLSWILSFINALIGLAPLLYVYFIIKEVLEVAPDFSQATSVVHNGIMAVVFAGVALLVYFCGLMCSHVAAFRIGIDTQTIEALHHGLARLLFHSRYGNPYETPDRMGQAKNTANILETMEETEMQARQPCQVGNTQRQGAGMGAKRERLLANRRQLCPTQVINKRIPCIRRV